MSFISSVKSFSSYTKGLYSVSEISPQEEFVELKLRFPLCFQSRLEKRIEKYKCSILSIDGVYAQISFFEPMTVEPEYFEVIAKIAKRIFSDTALSNLQSGDKVNIGMISTNTKKWLLDGFSAGKVRLIDMKIAEGHKHTKALTFECSTEQFERIKGVEYIGLNASGLMVREPYTLDGRYYFSIHVGRKTRETTVFGKEDLAPGTEFTLTFPFVS